MGDFGETRASCDHTSGDHGFARYEWQLGVAGFGEAGQAKLQAASVFISRVGGLGGLVAYELAAAGVGRLVLAHAGNIKISDLNRQLLATHQAIGQSRIKTAKQRLAELNPEITIDVVAENVSPENAARLISDVDVIVDCAPLFEERYAMNREAVRQRKPIVECSMYELESQLTTVIPGKTPCLACLYPEKPASWTREFPVFGAVSGSLGCMAAMEAIKLIAGLGEPLCNQLLVYDLGIMTFRKIDVQRRTDCSVCGGVAELVNGGD